MAKVNLFNQVRDFVEKINEAGGKPLYELTPEEARGVLRGVQEAKTEEPDVERKEAEIEVGGGRMMRLEITKPKGVTGELGVIYYIHGGGWVMGDNITHRRLVAELAADIVPKTTPLPVLSATAHRQTADRFPYQNPRWLPDKAAAGNLSSA